jgi:hypothetical protein
LNTIPENPSDGNTSEFALPDKIPDQDSPLPARPWWIHDAAWNQIVNTSPLQGMSRFEWVILCLRVRAPWTSVLPSEALDTSPPAFTRGRENLLASYQKELLAERSAVRSDYPVVPPKHPVVDVNMRIDRLEGELAEVLVAINSRLESLERQRQIGGR